MPLRFHWMLPKSGEVETRTARAAARYRVEAVLPDSPAHTLEMTGWVDFARRAERAGIDSLLISFSRFEPDPSLVACALGRETTRLGFILAVRSGVIAPAMLVQQINTLSGLIPARGDHPSRRVSLNLVAGSSIAEQHGYGDFLDHDQRYARADEFLAICNDLWRSDAPTEFVGEHYRIAGGQLSTRFSGPVHGPEIFVSGHSDPARRLAARRASCWLRVIDTPDALREAVADARARGLEVCLRACIVCRPTRAEALAVLDELLADPVVVGPSLARKDDSQMYREAASASSWLNPNLWTGLVAARGPVWTTLVGTPDELAAALLEYGRLGVTQFILSGWPELDELEIFGRDVLPRIRASEEPA